MENEKRVLHFTINGKEHSWHEQYITGAELRKLGDIPGEEELFLAIKKPWEDELIKDDTRVDLARPEIEHFYCKVIIIVNTRKKPWSEKEITFEQVIELAFGSYDPNPNKVYTVTYDRGPHQNPEGAMVKGDKVFVKNKMIFNAKATDKS